MDFFRRFALVRAYRDLRSYVSQREPYELGFLALAVIVTSFLVFAFAHDSYEEPVYRPNIVYVEQWRADRTDAQIIAQQKIDEPARQRELAEIRRLEEERRAGFKRLDDKLKRWGL